MGSDLSDIRQMAEDYTAAWNSGSPQAVASFFAEDSQIIINRGEPWKGRAGIAAMASGFFGEVPDLVLQCDDVRLAGSHALFVWSFTGHHAQSGNRLEVRGWEEWELDGDLKVKASLGWFDAAAYARQIEGG